MAATEKNNMELPGIPRKPGRPSTGKALTVAQRVARHRARKAQALHTSLKALQSCFQELDDNTLAQQIGSTTSDEYRYNCWIELGRRKGWLK